MTFAQFADRSADLGRKLVVGRLGAIQLGRGGPLGALGHRGGNWWQVEQVVGAFM